MAITMFTRFANLRNAMNVNNVNTIGAALSLTQRFSTSQRNLDISTDVFDQELSDVPQKPKQKINKAMKMYLERNRAYQEFMKKEISEYEIGKRHLANMMGEDPETFTQRDINKAIEYLFPSGIYDSMARPMMYHPNKIYPNQKEAQFDETGRPFNFLYYTGKPAYYNVLHDAVRILTSLQAEERKMIERGTLPDPKDKFDGTKSMWLSKQEMEKTLMEQLQDGEYEYLITTLERLMSHPLSAKAEDFLKNYRRKLYTIGGDVKVLPLHYTPDGRPYVKVSHCMRKSARGTVKVWGKGTGKIIINNKDIMYFEDVQCREQIVFPLIFSNMADKVDIVAHVNGGGPTGQSGAIRWGIAWGLRSFVDKEMIEKMRIAGLLTRDWRKRERKKFGQEGARRKFTWKKR